MASANSGQDVNKCLPAVCTLNPSGSLNYQCSNRKSTYVVQCPVHAKERVTYALNLFQWKSQTISLILTL